MANQNRFQRDGKKYKAVEQKPLIICGDCCFISDVRLEDGGYCLNSDCKISCIADDREDGRNIYWEEIKPK